MSNLVTAFVIGNFQVLTIEKKQYDALFDLSRSYSRVIVFLHVPVLPPTKKHPFDFETRKGVLHSAFRGLPVYPLKDYSDNRKWSEELDRMAIEIADGQDVAFFGDAAFFGSKYIGSTTWHPWQEPETSETVIPLIDANSKDPIFLAGMYHALQIQYDKVFATVDVAIMDASGKKVLLGRKLDEPKFRFIGGFSDPSDSSFEEAARREAKEETGLELGKLTCLGSTRMDDWRYRNEPDKVISTFFMGPIAGGEMKPLDDIAELQWFDLQSLKREDLMPVHGVLWDFLK